VYLKSGEYEKVLDVHARVCAQAETGGRQARVIELSLFKAVALQALGQPEAALESLEKCLALAEPGGYVRLFLETGEAVIELLREARAQGICPKYAAALLAAFQGEQAEAAPDRVASLSGGELIEPLTRRELEVLEWIYLGFTNQEIADQMVVSVNTVKKHTSNIYGKLGVRNRAQAVLCALELGLVQGD
jgi:LuxR family maltose regulon positive regulatory protein